MDLIYGLFKRTGKYYLVNTRVLAREDLIIKQCGIQLTFHFTFLELFVPHMFLKEFICVSCVCVCAHTHI